LEYNNLLVMLNFFLKPTFFVAFFQFIQVVKWQKSEIASTNNLFLYVFGISRDFNPYPQIALSADSAPFGLTLIAFAGPR
jgi:hypothetical protein